MCSRKLVSAVGGTNATPMFTVCQACKKFAPPPPPPPPLLPIAEEVPSALLLLCGSKGLLEIKDGPKIEVKAEDDVGQSDDHVGVAEADFCDEGEEQAGLEVVEAKQWATNQFARKGHQAVELTHFFVLMVENIGCRRDIGGRPGWTSKKLMTASGT